MSNGGNHYLAAWLLFIFFILVVGGALVVNHGHPVLAIAGEASVGTWMSGVLLIFAASFSMIIGIRQVKPFWYLIAMFFLILALDERFMFHEQMKEKLIFEYYDAHRSHIFYELPVVAGALVGAFFSFLLYRNFDRRNQALLIAATVLGSGSVLIDILNAGVVWEEIMKLIAELVIVYCMLRKASE